MTYKGVCSFNGFRFITLHFLAIFHLFMHETRNTFMFHVQDIYLKGHGNFSGRMDNINAVIEDVTKELNTVEQWAASRLHVTSLLQELRSLQTFGT